MPLSCVMYTSILLTPEGPCCSMAYSRLTCVALTSWRTGALLLGSAGDGICGDNAGAGDDAASSGTDFTGVAIKVSGVGRGAVIETISGDACDAVVKSG